jgi:hypothetical protein
MTGKAGYTVCVCGVQKEHHTDQKERHKLSGAHQDTALNSLDERLRNEAQKVAAKKVAAQKVAAQKAAKIQQAEEEARVKKEAEERDRQETAQKALAEKAAKIRLEQEVAQKERNTAQKALEEAKLKQEQQAKAKKEEEEARVKKEVEETETHEAAQKVLEEAKIKLEETAEEKEKRDAETALGEAEDKIRQKEEQATEGVVADGGLRARLLENHRKKKSEERTQKEEEAERLRKAEEEKQEEEDATDGHDWTRESEGKIKQIREELERNFQKHKVSGTLMIKVKGGMLTDTWPEVQCKINPRNNSFELGGGLGLIECKVTPQRLEKFDERAGKKPRRFNVFAEGGKNFELAASSDADFEIWTSSLAFSLNTSAGQQGNRKEHVFGFWGAKRGQIVQSWRRRYFVCDRVNRRIAYWKTSANHILGACQGKIEVLRIVKQSESLHLSIVDISGRAFQVRMESTAEYQHLIDSFSLSLAWSSIERL